jgi:hypothetical protein
VSNFRGQVLTRRFLPIRSSDHRHPNLDVHRALQPEPAEPKPGRAFQCMTDSGKETTQYTLSSAAQSSQGASKDTKPRYSGYCVSTSMSATDPLTNDLLLEEIFQCDVECPESINLGDEPLVRICDSPLVVPEREGHGGRRSPGISRNTFPLPTLPEEECPPSAHLDDHQPGHSQKIDDLLPQTETCSKTAILPRSSSAIAPSGVHGIRFWSIGGSVQPPVDVPTLPTVRARWADRHLLWLTNDSQVPADTPLSSANDPFSLVVRSHPKCDLNSGDNSEIGTQSPRVTEDKYKSNCLTNNAQRASNPQAYDERSSSLVNIISSYKESLESRRRTGPGPQIFFQNLCKFLQVPQVDSAALLVRAGDGRRVDSRHFLAAQFHGEVVQAMASFLAIHPSLQPHRRLLRGPGLSIPPSQSASTSMMDTEWFAADMSSAVTQSLEIRNSRRECQSAPVSITRNNLRVPALRARIKAQVIHEYYEKFSTGWIKRPGEADGDGSSNTSSDSDRTPQGSVGLTHDQCTGLGHNSSTGGNMLQEYGQAHGPVSGKKRSTKTANEKEEELRCPEAAAGRGTTAKCLTYSTKLVHRLKSVSIASP